MRGWPLAIWPLLLCLLLVAGPAHAIELEETDVDPAEQDQVLTGRRVALLFGVDDPRDSAFPPLRFASKDARDMAQVLQDPEAGGFHDVHLRDLPDDTTAAAILDQIEQIGRDLAPQDTFLLYFSGHGSLAPTMSGEMSFFLAGSDSRRDSIALTGVPVRQLQDRVADLAARRRVVILDACHNGGGKSALSIETAELLANRKGPEDGIAPGRVGTAEVHLYAASESQAALEDPELANGVYTHYLVKALGAQRRLADIDQDGVVTAAEAHDFARDRTLARTGGAQVPAARFHEVGREQVFLSGRPVDLLEAERGLLYSYSRLLASARVLIDGTPRGSLPQTIAVESGVRRIELVSPVDGRTLLDRRVRVRAGELTSVDRLMRRDPADRRFHFGVGPSYTSVTGALRTVLPRNWLGAQLTGVFRLPGLGPLALGSTVGYAYGFRSPSPVAPVHSEAHQGHWTFDQLLVFNAGPLQARFGGSAGIALVSAEALGPGAQIRPLLGGRAALGLWFRRFGFDFNFAALYLPVAIPVPSVGDLVIREGARLDVGLSFSWSY